MNRWIMPLWGAVVFATFGIYLHVFDLLVGAVALAADAFWEWNNA